MKTSNKLRIHNWEAWFIEIQKILKKGSFYQILFPLSLKTLFIFTISSASITAFTCASYTTSLSSSASQAFPIPSVSASSCPLFGCRGQLSYIYNKIKIYFTPNFFTYLSMSRVKKHIFLFFHLVQLKHGYSKVPGTIYYNLNALYHNWSVYNTILRYGK